MKAVSRRMTLRWAGPVAALAPVALAEPQPAMRSALRSLQAARNALQKGTEDKGGHRARALGLVSQAIDEVEKGIRFDNRR